MISDAERREVAKRLRSKKPAEFGEPLVRSVFRHVFRSLYPKQIYPVSNWVLRMPYALADLIDRPTCHISETDHEFEDSVRCDRCQMTFNRPWEPFKFCPNCGAEVVEDAR